MAKTHVYFVPGLAANAKIFDFISLPKSYFELHFLEWKLPLSVNESIESYAKRISENIIHEAPILIGVSFGGVIVQEVSKIINCQKIIIISSIKNRAELPNRLKIAQKTKAYKLFPTKIIENIEEYEQYFFGTYLKKRAELYKKYLSVRNSEYLEWAIYTILHWKQQESLKNVCHIHGNKDEIFPIKNIKNSIEIDQGTHIMILDKAKTISKILEHECTI